MTPFQRRLSLALIVLLGIALGVLGIVLIPDRYSGWVILATVVIVFGPALRKRARARRGA